MDNLKKQAEEKLQGQDPEQLKKQADNLIDKGASSFGAGSEKTDSIKKTVDGKIDVSYPPPAFS